MIVKSVTCNLHHIVCQHTLCYMNQSDFYHIVLCQCYLDFIIFNIIFVTLCQEHLFY